MEFDTGPGETVWYAKGEAPGDASPLCCDASLPPIDDLCVADATGHASVPTHVPRWPRWEGNYSLCTRRGQRDLTVCLQALVRSDWRGWRRIPSLDASGCRGKRSRTTARGGTTRRPSSVERPTHFSICAEEQQRISSAEIEAPRWTPDTAGRATAAAIPLGARWWRSGGLLGAYCTMSRLCPNPDHSPYNRARDRQRSGDLRPLLLHTPYKSRRDNDHLAVIRLIVRRHPANLADGDGNRRVARRAHLALDRSHLRAKQSEAHRASGIGQS